MREGTRSGIVSAAVRSSPDVKSCQWSSIPATYSLLLGTIMAEPAGQIPNLEADARLPSGEWTGFFLQPEGNPRTVKMDLTLKFRAGRIKGEGIDRFGEFSISGKYDLESGRVLMAKHSTTYRAMRLKGWAEKQHRGIWGIWEIKDEMTGGFHIWPKEEPNPTGVPIVADVALPVGQEADQVLEEAR